MRSSGLAIIGIIGLALAPTTYSEGIPEGVELPAAAEFASLKAEVASLRSIVTDLVELQRCHAIGGAAGRTHSENGTLGVDWRGCDKRSILLRGPLVPGITDNPEHYEMGALLVNARLVGTDFSGAYIRGVAMRGANLEGANFTNAILRWSDMTNAVIVTESLALAYGREQTIFKNTICPDGTNSDINDGDEFTCANNRTP